MCISPSYTLPFFSCLTTQAMYFIVERFKIYLCRHFFCLPNSHSPFIHVVKPRFCSDGLSNSLFGLCNSIILLLDLWISEKVTLWGVVWGLSGCKLNITNMLQTDSESHETCTKFFRAKQCTQAQYTGWMYCETDTVLT